MPGQIIDQTPQRIIARINRRIMGLFFVRLLTNSRNSRNKNDGNMINGIQQRMYSVLSLNKTLNWKVQISRFVAWQRVHAALVIHYFWETIRGEEDLKIGQNFGGSPSVMLYKYKKKLDIFPVQIQTSLARLVGKHSLRRVAGCRTHHFVGIT